MPRFRSIFLLGSVLALLAGVLLLTYARWTTPLVEAATAIDTRDDEAALAHYAESAERFRTFEPAQHILTRDYALMAHNRLALLYHRGEYDALLEAADAAPAEAAPQFWVGCALFAKSRLEEKPEAQLEWLSRAEDAFKLALTETPDDWDTKFNYEVTLRLTAALRASAQPGRQMQSAPSTMMQLLRPQASPRQQRPVKKSG